MNINRFVVFAGVLLLAGLVGVLAYNAGVSNGLAQNGKVVAAPYPYYYYPHHFWGGGFFFFPLFFFGFLLVARGLFWRRGWHHHHYRCRYEEPRSENDSDRR